VKPPFAGRHANELAVARLFRFVSELPEVPLRPRAIWFAHPPIADTRPLLAHFDTDDVRFLADTNGFSLAADVEDLAVVTSDPATLRVLTEYAEALLPRAGPTDELLSRLSEIVAGLVPDGGPTLQDVARRSGIGARTLQRRLADHGLTFATLVDGVRSDLAQHMLRDRGLAVTEAAFLLGYADGRAFARAFRRWTGKTPDSWRREARGQPPAR
jgi:AraC-like DNA-binding protein